MFIIQQFSFSANYSDFNAYLNLQNNNPFVKDKLFHLRSSFLEHLNKERNDVSPHALLTNHTHRIIITPQKYTVALSVISTK